MGSKRGADWLLLLALMIMAAVIVVGYIYGLNFPALQNIGKYGYNVSSHDPVTAGSIHVTEALPQDLADPAGTPSPSPRPSAFTISVEGGKDHRPGETLHIYGMDTYSDAVFLYLSCTKAPVTGGCLGDIQKPVVDRDGATFTRVNVSKDGSWDYFWTAPPGQPALLFDLYNLIAAAEPRDKPHLDDASNWDMVTVKISGL
jgi:hypothetical protein